MIETISQSALKASSPSVELNRRSPLSIETYEIHHSPTQTPD
ncbi:MAG: hypothetical protein VKL39_11325 [Leptolyngbyaceae bacterium]|nr:hypothetical protein [Leptolyngbyaceae bacterium]